MQRRTCVRGCTWCQFLQMRSANISQRHRFHQIFQGGGQVWGDLCKVDVVELHCIAMVNGKRVEQYAQLGMVVTDVAFGMRWMAKTLYRSKLGTITKEGWRCRLSTDVIHSVKAWPLVRLGLGLEGGQLSLQYRLELNLKKSILPPLMTTQLDGQKMMNVIFGLLSIPQLGSLG